MGKPPQQQQASNELWLSAFRGLGTGITGSPVLPASTFTPVVVPPPFNEYADDFINSATLGRNTSNSNDISMSKDRSGSLVLPGSTFTPVVVPPPFNEYADDFITSATLGRNTSPFDEYADDFITSATLGRNTSPFNEYADDFITSTTLGPNTSPFNEYADDFITSTTLGPNTSPFNEYADDFITSATLGRNTSPFNEYADDFITSATLGRNTSNSNDISTSKDRSGSSNLSTSAFTPVARPKNIPPGFPFARQPIGDEVFQLCPNCGERKHASKKAWRVCQEPCWRCGKKHETEVRNGKLTVRCPRNKTYPGYEPPGNKNKPEHWTLSATIRNAKKDGRLLEDPETGLFYEPKSPYNNVDPNAVESNDVTSRVNSETDDRQQKRPRLQSNASHSSSPQSNFPSMGLQLNTAPRPFMGLQLNTALRPSMGLQLNTAPSPSMGPQNTTAPRPREPSSSRREVFTSRPLPRQAMNPDVGLYVLTRAQYYEMLGRITCLEDANHLEHVRRAWQPMAIAIGRHITHTTRQGSKGLEVLEYDFYSNTGGWVLVPQ
ncbi:hypothetical protein EG327_003343 [Venturia inaequalis]|uniref:Uncharacterized protein n=1 Tax=Venturia inaequalis TaxID=5025 RepID=A0A8H3VEI4_VENIN|nr:hypothetical protein EG327_003343 [Venturia inaequalis]